MVGSGTIPLGYRGGFVGWADTSRHSASLRAASPPAAFNSPLLATGLVLSAVDLATAVLAARLFGRIHAAALDPSSGSVPGNGSQTLLLVLAAMLALLPLMHLVSKLLVFAAPRSSRRRAWLRAAVAALCVPASLCRVITLLLTTGH